MPPRTRPVADSTPPPDFTPDDEAWAVIRSLDFFSSMLPFFDPQKIAEVAPSTMFPILNAMKPALATFRSKVPRPSLKIQRFLHTVFKAVRALCRGHQELNRKIFLDQAPSPDAAFRAELAAANMSLLQKGFVLPKPPPPPVYPDTLELTEDEAEEEDVDVPSSDAEPPAKIARSAKSRDKASGKPVKATPTPTPAHDLRRRQQKDPAPAVKASASKKKAKPPPQSSPPPEASSSKVTLDDDAARGPATRVEMYEQAVAPSGGWANTKETPFPAFKKVSRYVVGDFFSPSLYERAILKCIPCINRNIQCGGFDLFSPCLPCKEQHVKCLRSNTTMEHLLLFDSLRPHFGLSPDALSQAFFRALSARQHAEVLNVLTIRAYHDLDIANNSLQLVFENQSDVLDPALLKSFFELPSDYDDMREWVERYSKSRRELVLSADQQYPVSGVLRMDPAKDHSVENSYHTHSMPESYLHTDPRPSNRSSEFSQNIFASHSAVQGSALMQHPAMPSPPPGSHPPLPLNSLDGPQPSPQRSRLELPPPIHANPAPPHFGAPGGALAGSSSVPSAGGTGDVGSG
ncbi:hypothetical protein B0H16DRAFT_1656754 [Mycena metata]|uniref:Uncharacterized protein n=1 Tax=Mycena metata TaxID=1033252 RepID=A0AAD7DD61_9AGAR|nr:hypothetical protein B0H16DRAFT_1656754 [Mycena metata]